MFGYLGFFSYIYSKLTLMKKSRLKQLIKEEISNILNEETPSWFTILGGMLADKLDVEVRDLALKIVDPHLIEVGADFSQEGLDNFPRAINSVLRSPELKGKMKFVGNERIEDAIIDKHPELEDYILNDEMFWIYIK